MASSIPMEQIERLSEMKMNRLDREYRACVAATRSEQQLPLDSKSASKTEQPSLSYYSRLPANSKEADDDNNNWSNSAIVGQNLEENNNEQEQEQEQEQEVSEEQLATTTTTTTTTAAAAAEPPRIHPLTDSAASTIKSLMNGMSICPSHPQWAPKTKEGDLDKDFDLFVAERVNNWGKEDFDEFTRKEEPTVVAVDGGTASGDMEQWVATFNEDGKATNSAGKKRKKKKKKKKKKL